MPKPNRDPKTAPGLVSIRLQVTAEERDQYRTLATLTPQRTMALRAREVVRADIARLAAKNPK